MQKIIMYALVGWAIYYLVKKYLFPNKNGDCNKGCDC